VDFPIQINNNQQVTSWPRADLLETAALCFSKKREQQIKQTKTVKPYSLA